MRIAALHGWASWRALYEHSDNRELRRRRSDPRMLRPGDRVCIPPPPAASAPIEARRSNQLTGTPHECEVNFRLALDEGAALAGQRWELVVGTTVHTGTTGDDGVLRVAVPAREISGTLRLFSGEALRHQVRVAIGHMPPVDDVDGVQARLRNLGYGCEVTGSQCDRTREAIRLYQSTFREEPTGQLDDETRARLVADHGI